MLRPGIVGMRGSKPYGHTTTAMHEYRAPPHTRPHLARFASDKPLTNESYVLIFFRQMKILPMSRKQRFRTSNKTERRLANERPSNNPEKNGICPRTVVLPRTVVVFTTYWCRVQNRTYLELYHYETPLRKARRRPT